MRRLPDHVAYSDWADFRAHQPITPLNGHQLKDLNRAALELDRILQTALRRMDTLELYNHHRRAA